MRRQTEARCTAQARALREESDVSGELLLAERARRQRQAAARRTRRERQTELDIRHSEPVLREEALIELHCLEDPMILETRLKALEDDPEIGSHETALTVEVIDRQVLQCLAAA